MVAGWIKMHRKLLENPIMKKPELLQLFLYCLLKANHESGKVIYGTSEIEVQRGQFITGRFELSHALNCKDTTIWKRLQTLRKMNFVDTKSNNKNTLVTIVNYDLYQSEVSESDNKSTTKVTTKGQQSDTNKNKKNDKNNKKNKYSEFVSLTDEEYKKLIDKYGEINTKRYIEKLNNYKDANGRKYSSDYRAILNWVVESVGKEEKKNNLYLFDTTKYVL